MSQEIATDDYAENGITDFLPQSFAFYGESSNQII